MDTSFSPSFNISSSNNSALAALVGGAINYSFSTSEETLPDLNMTGGDGGWTIAGIVIGVILVIAIIVLCICNPFSSTTTTTTVATVTLPVEETAEETEEENSNDTVLPETMEEESSDIEESVEESVEETVGVAEGEEESVEETVESVEETVEETVGVAEGEEESVEETVEETPSPYLFEEYKTGINSCHGSSTAYPMCISSWGEGCTADECRSKALAAVESKPGTYNYLWMSDEDDSGLVSCILSASCDGDNANFGTGNAYAVVEN